MIEPKGGNVSSQRPQQVTKSAIATMHWLTHSAMPCIPVIATTLIWSVEVFFKQSTH